MEIQKNILIVDDDDNFLEIFSAKLKAAGFDVKTAEGGENGVKAAKAIKPDMILMDMEMPDLNGAAVTMKLKEDPVTKDIKIVFLTNYGDPRIDAKNTDIHFSKELGAFDYLRKTDDLDSTVSRVKEILGVE